MEEEKKEVQSAAENVNIKVEKKRRRSIIPLLFVIIIILIGIIGILIFDKNSSDTTLDNNTSQSNEDSSDTTLDNNTSQTDKDSSDTTLDNNNSQTDKDTTDEINKVEEKVEDERKSEISKEAQAVYDKYKDADWVSNGIVENFKLFEIKEGKIYYTNGEMEDKLVPFNYGTPKYLKQVIGGGVLQYLSVITEDGKVCFIKVPDTFLGNENFDFENGFEYEQITFGEKVIDMMINNKNVIISGPYYLTESGKLVNKDNKTYEEINRNHVAVMGNIYRFVYLNEDLTLETLRSENGNEYMYVVDKNGEKVKAKYAFIESSTRWTGTTSDHYYLVDEANNLLDFSADSLFVASEYYDAKTKKVKKLEYDEKDRSMKIIFEDNSYIVIEDCQNYIKAK